MPNVTGNLIEVIRM